MGFKWFLPKRVRGRGSIQITRLQRRRRMTQWRCQTWSELLIINSTILAESYQQPTQCMNCRSTPCLKSLGHLVPISMRAMTNPHSTFSKTIPPSSTTTLINLIQSVVPMNLAREPLPIANSMTVSRKKSTKSYHNETSTTTGLKSLKLSMTKYERVRRSIFLVSLDSWAKKSPNYHRP